MFTIAVHRELTLRSYASEPRVIPGALPPRTRVELLKGSKEALWKDVGKMSLFYKNSKTYLLTTH